LEEADVTDDVEMELLGEFVDRVVDREEDRLLTSQLMTTLAQVDVLLARGKAIADLRGDGRLGRKSREVLQQLEGELQRLATVLEKGSHHGHY
jgi:hypothetical protein